MEYQTQQDVRIHKSIISIINNCYKYIIDLATNEITIFLTPKPINVDNKSQWAFGYVDCLKFITVPMIQNFGKKLDFMHT